ncbi:MAG: rod shape-determining protein MreC [Bacteroidetes bacterium]|jgi:rod shape-determining protein MreC|nr:rod shape-determining protein MreC [Bacteroidota bacterium]PTM20045.1 MAG: rod shape-determining protein MreC [Bacteroidota bacterium]
MRRLIEVKDTILTALLLVAALFLMAERTSGGLNNVRTVSVAFLSIIEEPLSQVSTYRQALETNRYLQRQNVLLQDELNRLRSAESELQSLRSMLALKTAGQPDLIPAKVIAKQLTGLNNFITLDAGERQGVKPGMPVISSDGLVGTIILTGSGVSQVMPYANTLFRASARIQDSRAYGVAGWSRDQQRVLHLDYIPKTIPVNIGDIAETSGYGNRYPSGLILGEVIQTDSKPGEDTQRVLIRSKVELHTLSELFIIPFQPDSSVQTLQNLQEDLF